MKALCILLVLIFSLSLSGCGDKQELEQFRNFQDELSMRETISFCSELCCEYPEKTLKLRLYYEENPEGALVKVLEPQELSGITASFLADGSSLNCGELSIDTGNLDIYGLSPMTALPCLAKILKEAYALSSWNDNDFTVYELSLNEHLKADVFFNPLNMLPVKAEIISGDSVKVFASIDNWLKIME